MTDNPLESEELSDWLLKRMSEENISPKEINAFLKWLSTRADERDDKDDLEFIPLTELHQLLVWLKDRMMELNFSVKEKDDLAKWLQERLKNRTDIANEDISAVLKNE